jgi:predicted TIM-barrel fold metal-dependent hydrolase
MPETVTAPCVVDADLHNYPLSLDDLLPYLDDYWREYATQTGFHGATESAYPPGAPNTGLSPRETFATPAALEAAAFAAGAPERAILACTYEVDGLTSPYASLAVARAVNDWQVEHWLSDPDSRLRASIVVPSRDPALAAPEIERMAKHEGFVQVYLPIRTELPLGKRLFRPIFEAIAKHDLVACLHFGGHPPVPPTATGWPTFYAEQYAGMASVAQTQLTSLIAEGVLEELPDLRVTVAEAGFAWLVQWLWRFDKDWQMLQREIPWTKRPPAEYVSRQVRLTLRPIDGPRDVEELAAVVEEHEPVHLGSLLMYSSDFPHEHGDGPDLAFLDHVSEQTREAILHRTAESWYRLR